MKEALESMLVCKHHYKLEKVLALINKENLQILEEENDLQKELTLNNENINKEEVIEYILRIYPALKRYTNLNTPLTLIEYRKIEKEFGDYLSFYSMPQSLNFIENKNLDKKKVRKKENHI